MTRRAYLCCPEQIINESSVVDARDPVTCKGREIGTQMMWLEQMDHVHLGNMRHYFKNPLTPMEYHVKP
jgi:hypothetical protein